MPDCQAKSWVLLLNWVFQAATELRGHSTRRFRLYIRALENIVTRSHMSTKNRLTSPPWNHSHLWDINDCCVALYKLIDNAHRVTSCSPYRLRAHSFGTSEGFWRTISWQICMNIWARSVRSTYYLTSSLILPCQVAGNSGSLGYFNPLKRELCSKNRTPLSDPRKQWPRTMRTHSLWPVDHRDGHGHWLNRVRHSYHLSPVSEALVNFWYCAILQYLLFIADSALGYTRTHRDQTQQATNRTTVFKRARSLMFSALWQWENSMISSYQWLSDWHFGSTKDQLHALGRVFCKYILTSIQAVLDDGRTVDRETSSRLAGDWAQLSCTDSTWMIYVSWKLTMPLAAVIPKTDNLSFQVSCQKSATLQRVLWKGIEMCVNDYGGQYVVCTKVGLVEQISGVVYITRG